MKFKNTTNVLLPLISAAIVIRFSLLVYKYAVNLPIWDDFDSVLFALNEYRENPAFTNFLSIILRQHNEHRVVVNKLLMFFDYWIFGKVNFLHLIYLSTAALITFAILMGAKSKEAAAAVLIGVAVILQPQYGDGLNWVTTSVASFSLALIVLLCSILITRPKINFLILFPLIALACFTQGNGILVPFCLFFTLLLEKRWKDAVFVIIFGSIVCGLYFIGFNKPSNSLGLTQITENLKQLFEYGFTLVGASLGFSEKTASLVSGVILTLLFIIVLCSVKLRKNSALIPVLFFLFLSAALNTYARAINFYQFVLSPGRYTILSSAITASILIIFFNYLSEKKSRWRYIPVAAAIFFNFYSYKYYEVSIEQLYSKTLNDLGQYTSTGNSGLTYPWPDRGLAIIEDSAKKGTYKLPVDEMNLYTISQINPSEYSKDLKKSRAKIDRFQIGKEYINIQGWAFVKKCDSKKTEITIKLDSKESTLLISPIKTPRDDVAYNYKIPEYYYSGFYTLFPKTMLNPEQDYTFELLLKCGDSKFKFNSYFLITGDEVKNIKEVKNQKQS